MLIDLQSYRHRQAGSAPETAPARPRACEVETRTDGILPADLGSLERELLNYWRWKRGERAMPRPDDIRASEIPGLLHAIAIIDDRPQSRYRLKVRFAGRELEYGFGHAIAGHYLDRIYDGSDYWEVMAQYRDSLDNARVTFRRRDVVDRRNLRWSHDRLILPLSSAGDSADALLIMVSYRQAA